MKEPANMNNRQITVIPGCVCCPEIIHLTMKRKRNGLEYEIANKRQKVDEIIDLTFDDNQHYDDEDVESLCNHPPTPSQSEDDEVIYVTTFYDLETDLITN